MKKRAATGETRERVYDFYVSYWQTHGHAPFYWEVGKAVDLCVNTVYYHISHLIKDNRLEYDNSQVWRSVRPVIKTRRDDET